MFGEKAAIAALRIRPENVHDSTGAVPNDRCRTPRDREMIFIARIHLGQKAGQLREIAQKAGRHAGILPQGCDGYLHPLNPARYLRSA